MRDPKAIRKVLQDSGALQDVLPSEVCALVLPSARVLAGKFAVALAENGIPVRPLAVGTGQAKDAIGAIVKVKGVLVIAYPATHKALVSKLAKMMRVTVETV